MRKIRTLDPKLLEKESVKTEIDSVADEYRLKLFEVHGVECAAWLAWEHRKKLRRGRAVQFKIPIHADIPIWFSLALKKLGQRGWYIAFKSDKKFAYWIVSWKAPYNIAVNDVTSLN